MHTYELLPGTPYRLPEWQNSQYFIPFYSINHNIYGKGTTSSGEEKPMQFNQEIQGWERWEVSANCAGICKNENS